jgi:hypothetical protein
MTFLDFGGSYGGFGILTFDESGGGEGAVVVSGPVTLIRLEVWSTWECAGGTRQAFIPLSECAVLTTTERVQHDDEGQLVLSRESAGAASIETGVVIRFLYSNGSYDEWVVWTIDDTSRESRVIRVSLRSVLTELDSGRAVLSESTAVQVTTVDLEWKALTPETHVDQIMAFAPTWFTAGTVTPTIPVDLAPSGWMPLRALRELVAAIRAQAVGCELHYRRNGTTGYFIDIVTTIGSSESALSIRTTKNLLGTSRRRDREKYAVEVVPLGTGSPRATIGRAWWELTVKSTNVLTFQQPVTGGSMIGFNDQLNTVFYLIDNTGAKIQILDCDASTQQITVTSGTNFTVGRWYRVAADSTGNEVVRLPKLAGTTGPVRLVESSTLDGNTNFIDNPAMREWAGASSDPPDGWSSTLSSPGTITRTTTTGLWKFGGKSARCVAASGQFKSPTLSVYVPTWVTSITTSIWLYPVTLATQGQVIFFYDGVSKGAGSGGITTTSTASLPLNQWSRVDHTVITGFSVGGTHSLQAAFLSQGGGTPDHYVDSMQIIFASEGAEFVEGSNPAKLWALGNQYLGTYSSVPTSYGVTFADLHQWDPVGFPYDHVALGQTANVVDSDLEITTSGRIIELRRDWKNPLASQLTVTTRPEEFVSLLTGIAA